MNGKSIGAIALAVVALGGGVLLWQQTASTEKGSDSSLSKQEVATRSNEEKNTSESGARIKLADQTVGSKVDCSLYTLNELSTLWGVSMVDTDDTMVTSLSDGGKLYSCNYNETDSGLGLSVILEYREFNSEEAAKMDMANVRDGAKFGDQVYFIQDEQSGIGDEALFSVSKNGKESGKNPTEQLYLRKGNLVMLMTATNLDGAKPDYREKILKTYKLHFE